MICFSFDPFLFQRQPTCRCHLDFLFEAHPPPIGQIGGGARACARSEVVSTINSKKCTRCRQDTTRSSQKEELYRPSPVRGEQEGLHKAVLWTPELDYLLLLAKGLFLSPLTQQCSMTGCLVPHQLSPCRACALAAAVIALAAVERPGMIAGTVTQAASAPTVDLPGPGTCVHDYVWSFN